MSLQDTVCILAEEITRLRDSESSHNHDNHDMRLRSAQLVWGVRTFFFFWRLGLGATYGTHPALVMNESKLAKSRA